jgi:hypothetical protein
MKRDIIFIDAAGNKVKAVCEITTRNGYPEFTMCGDYGNGSGQIFDDVQPVGENQRKLIRLWEEWHLNGMSAGTPEQVLFLKNNKEEIKRCIEVNRLNGLPDSDYSVKVTLLKNAGLHEVKHPETGKPFKYGEGWYHKVLPDNFEDELNVLLDAIEEEEEEKRKGAQLCADLSDEELLKLVEDGGSFSDPETVAALGKMFNLTVEECLGIDEDGGNCYTVQGVTYLAGTDEEMDEAWDKELDSYLDECVLPELPESMREYFDDEAWKSDARGDGRGHALNRYNGGEEETEFNGVYYYAYRQ